MDARPQAEHSGRVQSEQDQGHGTGAPGNDATQSQVSYHSNTYSKLSVHDFCTPLCRARLSGMLEV